VTEIAIQFKRAAPHAVFGDNGDGTTPNLLILRIQPEEGISLRFLSKRPGAGMNLAAGVDGFQLTARASANGRRRRTKPCYLMPW